VRLLRDLGYTNLRHYRGGLGDWKDAGGALEAVAASTAASAAGVAEAELAPRQRRQWGSAFLEFIERRSPAHLFLAWLAMIVLCSLAYWLAGFTAHDGLLSGGRHLDASPHNLLVALYFSFVTATSVGYGDVVPLGLVRALAIAEAVAGLLIFGAVVAKFVSRRQDELVQEIHRVTFAERLERVQTSLHLVLSEIQAIAALCDGGAIRPERMTTRLESTALVFASELRAVHDLLYRPRWAPEEAILDAILATLAAALRELRDLLACLPAAVVRSPALADTLRTIARFADEICGKCVPYEYAPALTVWMDRVHELARSIAA
jgi:Ion channel